MAKLEHEKHEMFCHFIARGNIPVTAYVGAGYSRDPKAAEALMNIPAIKARIEELKPYYHERYRTRVSPQTILKQRREVLNAKT